MEDRMTRERLYGSDTPFCDWMRQCRELPSYSRDCGFVATDGDVTIHRYLSSVDSVGTREVQGMMDMEVKTRGGNLSQSQRDTLFKKHKCATYKRGFYIKGQYVRHFGVSLVLMSGLTPDDSEQILWGRFTEDGEIRVREVHRKTLIRLMRFELHPDNLTERPFRRHHLTQEIVVTETSPLGFKYDKLIRKES
jgi:hypothetical protein